MSMVSRGELAAWCWEQGAQASTPSPALVASWGGGVAPTDVKMGVEWCRMVSNF